MLYTRKTHFNTKLPLVLGWLAFGTIALGVAVIPSFTPDNTNATTDDSIADNVDYYLNLASSDAIEIAAHTSTTGTYASTKDSLNITTNIPTGYKLYLSANSDGAEQNSLYNISTPEGQTPSKITATGGSLESPAVLDDNTWGYGIPLKDSHGQPVEGLTTDKFDESYSAPVPAQEAKWAAIPAKTTGDVTDYADLIQWVDHSNEATGGNNLDIYYGTKLTSTITSGNYAGAITYTALADIPIPKDTYRVHYESNGEGVSQMPADEEYETTTSFVGEPEHTFQLKDLDSSTIPTRAGYTFGGWTEVKADGATYATNQAAAYSPGSELYLHYDSDPEKNKTDTTLYAIWIPDSEMGFGGITTMQEMTSSICDDVPITDPATTGRLQDTRDYKVYYVTKEADGHCWMTQNLALELRGNEDGKTGKALTTADSNVSDDWMPERSTVPNGNLSPSRWATSSDYYHPYSFNPADDYFVTNDATTGTDQETPTGDAHYTAGNYYTWSAAVASNNTEGHSTQYENMPDSICPRGWRLPKNGSSYTSSDSEYSQLLINSGITTASNPTTYNGNGFLNIRKDPLWLVRSGYVVSGSRDILGGRGLYWSSAVGSSSYAYSLDFYQYGPNPMYDVNRSYGRSIRCLAE